jgi:hypothetical protein
MEYAIKITFQFGHLLNLFTFFQHSKVEGTNDFPVHCI